jgi:hypothetical protein
LEKNPQNIQRSLIQLFGKPVGAPDFNWFKIPLKNGRYALHPFLLPHKFFEQLYKERRQDFQRYLQGPVGAAQQYWEHLQDSAYVRLHPKLHSNNFATMIPLGLHGDAGAYSKQDSLMVISWNSILGRGNTRRKRFVFTFLRKRDYTPETLNAVWHIFASSINKLLECTEAGGWRATLSQVRGDWAFFCEIFRFPQWNAKDYMCWCCRASSSTAETFWTDVGPNAGWRHTLYTHESYLEHLAAMGLAIPVLFLLIIGFRLECCMVDILHAMDLGWQAHILGNVFWETITRRNFGGANIKDNVTLLEKDMHNFYTRSKTSCRLQGGLNPQRIRKDGGYPKLKSKGAAARHLAPYALELARKFNDNSEHDRIKIALCQNTVQFYEILNNNSQFFTDSVQIKFASTTQQMAILYNYLHSEAFQNGIRTWRMVPKVHCVQHSAETQSQVWGNPSYYWTYADEDLVGLMIEIAESCHPNTKSVIALVKWLILAFDVNE